ncbi:MAG: hypothetical protein LBV04_07900 [Deferribacteraceae bacterium]|jgi:hypothetical protein|nr:hypothetical protein [Deferribacteraceae bacterium]
MYGRDLKQAMYDGRFTGRGQVEEFIATVLANSPNALDDFLAECGHWAFEKYGASVQNTPSISVDELAERIGNDHPNGSQFSNWIRARFIKEICIQNLQ